MWSFWQKKPGFRFQRSSLCTPGLAMYVPYSTSMENKNFFASGAATNGPGLRRSSTFLISGAIQRLLNSIQLALSLSEQTFLFETRKLGPARDSCTWEWALCATLPRAQGRVQMQGDEIMLGLI